MKKYYKGYEINYIIEKANKNNPEACYYLGQIYYFGIMNDIIDYNKALKWFLRAQELGYYSEFNIVLTKSKLGLNSK